MNPLELAERIEAATGPDRELDLAIYHLIQPERYRWAEFGGAHPSQRILAVRILPEWMERIHRWGDEIDVVRIPAYSSSLDAAISLKLDGWLWDIGNGDKDSRAPRTGNYAVFVNMANPTVEARALDTATPALALCAAALRARAALPAPARLNMVSGDPE